MCALLCQDWSHSSGLCLWDQQNGQSLSWDPSLGALVTRCSCQGPASQGTAGGQLEPPSASETLAVRSPWQHLLLLWYTNCRFAGATVLGSMVPLLAPRVGTSGGALTDWPWGWKGRALGPGLGPYLNGVLELLMLPLQLLCLLQRAGRDEPGVQHGLSVADPAQHLEHDTGDSQQRSLPGRLSEVQRDVARGLGGQAAPVVYGALTSLWPYWQQPASLPWDLSV